MHAVFVNPSVPRFMNGRRQPKRVPDGQQRRLMNPLADIVLRTLAQHHRAHDAQFARVIEIEVRTRTGPGEMVRQVARPVRFPPAVVQFGGGILAGAIPSSVSPNHRWSDSRFSVGPDSSVPFDRRRLTQLRPSPTPCRPKCSGHSARYVTAEEMPLALASTASRVKRISASSSVCESMSFV